MPNSTAYIYPNMIYQNALGNAQWQDAYRAILLANTYTPNQLSHTTFADVSAHQMPTANGYTQNGLAMAPTVALVNREIRIDNADLVWPDTTLSCKYICFVRDANADGTLAAGDLLMGFADLNEGAGDMVTTGGDLTYTFAANGLFRSQVEEFT